MIKTRDFILFLLILFFILTGIVFTLGSNSEPTGSAPSDHDFKVATPSDINGALVTAKDADDDTLTRLRAKVAAGDGVSLSAPPVMTSVDSPSEETVVSEATTSPLTAATYCGPKRPASVTATWPTDTAINQIENGIEVLVNTTKTVAVGSSTETISSTEILTSLPHRTVRSTFDSCLPDSTIGITTGGQPLDNQSAYLYSNTSALSVIGYTRDGFVIYAAANGDSTLDACGGHYVNGVYQYQLRPEQESLITCYAGIPIDLNF